MIYRFTSGNTISALLDPNMIEIHFIFARRFPEFSALSDKKCKTLHSVIDIHLIFTSPDPFRG